MSRNWLMGTVSALLIMPALGRAADDPLPLPQPAEAPPPVTIHEPAQDDNCCPGRPRGLLQRAEHVKEKVQAVKERAQAVKERVADRLQTPGPVRHWYRESDHPLWQWGTYRSDRPPLCGCLPQWDPCLPPPLYTFFLTPDCGNGCRPPKVLKCRERESEWAARIRLMLDNLCSLTDLRNLDLRNLRAKRATPVVLETPESR